MHILPPELIQYYTRVRVCRLLILCLQLILEALFIGIVPAVGFADCLLIGTRYLVLSRQLISAMVYKYQVLIGIVHIQLISVIVY